jgi:hypothetical protein
MAKIFSHPLVLTPFAIALLSTLLAPWASLPKLTFFGAPELGEGVFWFLILGTFVASTLTVFEHPTARRALGITAVLSTIVVSVLVALSFKTYFGITFKIDRPYYFDDYLAFYGLFLFAIGCTCFGLHRLRSQLGWFALCAIPVFLSGNKTALLLGAIIVPSLGFFWCFIHRFFPLKERLLSTVATFLLPIPLLLSIALVAHHYGNTRLETLWSRNNLTLTALEATIHHPERLLVGMGWGSYVDATIEETTPTRSVLYQGHKQHNMWEFLFSRTAFHSHNELAEALLSIGILGLLLVWLWYPLLPWCATPTYLRIATLTGMLSIGLGATWFQMPVTLPFMAIAFASLTYGRVNTLFWPMVTTRFYMLAPLLAAGMAWGFYDNFWTVRHNVDFQPPPMLQNAATCGDGLVDFNRGGLVLTQYFRDTENAFKLVPKEAMSAGFDKRAHFMQCVVNRQWEHNPSLRLMASDLVTYSDWAFYEDAPEIIPPYAFDGWEAKLTLWLDRLPNRSDMAAPYFMWKLSRQEEADIQPLVDRLLKHNPEDPIGLWFSGIHLLKEAETFEKGKRRMQRALALGLERIMPIEEAILKELKM